MSTMSGQKLKASIGDYALLGDCHGAALVSRDGSIDWWCPPRFDARSIFARLLDPQAGHWSIRPGIPFEVDREYVAGTMVVQTTFRTERGVLRLCDALALGSGERGHDIGFRSPHALVRVVEAVAGDVPVAVEFTPRPEYGLVEPTLISRAGVIQTVGGADTLFLASERDFEVQGSRAVAEFVLTSGESAAFTAQYVFGINPERPEVLDTRVALADTVAGWRSWSELHQRYEGVYVDQVHRSALVLQSLTYQPTGAVVAAPTTSLPEEVGGASNWDYRFAWLRDASFTLKALWVGACPDEAARYFAFMGRAAGAPNRGDHVQIMFGVEGERDLTEHRLPHLAGYRDSVPVRIGNDAWTQKQLDVMGEVLESAYVMREQIGQFDELTAWFLRGLADRAAETWDQPDAGIWEGREGERQYLTSKLMCWVALDRAVKLADVIAAGEDATQHWAAARDEVRSAILERGWHDAKGAYTGAFGSDHLDAGVLLMPIVGFVPATDDRMRRTIDVIERELGQDGLVRRWTGAEAEGAFVICSYWLAHCRARAGDVEHAKAIFEAVSGYANDLGLLSEEIDPGDGEMISNFPQALSHIGLIEAAWEIQQAIDRTRARQGGGNG